MKKIIQYLTILMISTFILAGCTPTQDSENPQIAVTFYPYYDLTKHIAGELADVYSVVPTTIDPHSFDPSPRDITRLQSISAYVKTGVEFEAFEKTLLNAIPQHVPIIDASAGISILDSDHTHDEHPHEFEWAGVYMFEQGEYTLTFSQVDGKYEDPSIKMVIIATDEGDAHGIEEVEHDAEALFENDQHNDIVSGGITNPGEVLYKLIFDEEQEETSFIMQIEEPGYYVIFMEHHPHEFEGTTPFITNAAGNEIYYLAEEEDEHGDNDPHVWLSPQNAMWIAENILRGLQDALPEQAEAFVLNFAELISALQQLDTEYQQELSNCEKDTILVTHNAYQYLARDYGFYVESISGLSHESEPTPRQLANLVDAAREHNISVVYFEELVDSRIAETIAREVGAQVLPLSPIEGSTEGKTYIALMRENLNNLKVGLVC